MLIEIRINSRGGQGGKTAGELIAETALDEGKNVQAFSQYGPERSGAPVETYVKISDEEILSYSALKHAEIVLIIDESLIDEKVVENIADSCIMVVNSSKNVKVKLEELGFKGYLYQVDGTKIALEELGKNIPNVALIGGFIKASREKVIKLSNLNKRIKSLLKRKGEKVVDANVKAARRAYDEIKKC